MPARCGLSSVTLDSLIRNRGAGLLSQPPPATDRVEGAELAEVVSGRRPLPLPYP